MEVDHQQPPVMQEASELTAGPAIEHHEAAAPAMVADPLVSMEGHPAQVPPPDAQTMIKKQEVEQRVQELLSKKEFEEAIRVQDEYLQRLKEDKAALPMEVASGYKMLGDLQREAGKVQEAIQSLEASLEIHRNTTPDHPSTKADVLSTLARYCNEAGQQPKAQVYGQELTDLQKHHNLFPPNTLTPPVAHPQPQAATFPAPPVSSSASTGGGGKGGYDRNQNRARAQRGKFVKAYLSSNIEIDKPQLDEKKREIKEELRIPEREFWDKMEEYCRKSKKEKKPKIEEIQKHIRVPDKEDVTGTLDEWWWELVDGNDQPAVPPGVTAWPYPDRRYRGSGGVQPAYLQQLAATPLPVEDASKMVNDEVVVNSLLQLSKAAMPTKFYKPNTENLKNFIHGTGLLHRFYEVCRPQFQTRLKVAMPGQGVSSVINNQHDLDELIKQEDPFEERPLEDPAAFIIDSPSHPHLRGIYGRQRKYANGKLVYMRPEVRVEAAPKKKNEAYAKNYVIGNMVKIELAHDEVQPDKYKRFCTELFLDEGKIYLDPSSEPEVQAQAGGKPEKADTSKDKKNKIQIGRDDSGVFQFPGGTVEFCALKSVIVPEEYIQKSDAPRLIPIDFEAMWEGFFPGSHSIPLDRFLSVVPDWTTANKHALEDKPKMVDFFLGCQLDNMAIKTVTAQDYVKFMRWFVGAESPSIPILQKVHCLWKFLKTALVDRDRTVARTGKEVHFVNLPLLHQEWLSSIRTLEPILRFSLSIPGSLTLDIPQVKEGDAEVSLSSWETQAIFYMDETGEVHLRFHFRLEEEKNEVWDEEIDHCKILRRVFGDHLYPVTTRGGVITSMPVPPPPVVMPMFAAAPPAPVMPAPIPGTAEMVPPPSIPADLPLMSELEEAMDVSSGGVVSMTGVVPMPPADLTIDPSQQGLVVKNKQASPPEAHSNGAHQKRGRGAAGGGGQEGARKVARTDQSPVTTQRI